MAGSLICSDEHAVISPLVGRHTTGTKERKTPSCTSIASSAIPTSTCCTYIHRSTIRAYIVYVCGWRFTYVHVASDGDAPYVALGAGMGPGCLHLHGRRWGVPVVMAQPNHHRARIPVLPSPSTGEGEAATPYPAPACVAPFCSYAPSHGSLSIHWFWFVRARAVSGPVATRVRR